MKISGPYKKWFYRIAVAILFVFAMAHRLVYLGSYPLPHSTDDEYHYLWAGMSMMNGESPRTWSFLPSEPSSLIGHFPMTGQMYPIVQPSFDHPPLFSFLSGVMGKLSGAEPITVPVRNPVATTVIWDVWMGKIRLLPVALFGVSYWLLWLLGRLVAGRRVALMALVMYSTLEYFNLHQRLAVPDSLLTVLVLGAFLTLELWRRGRITTGKAAVLVIVSLVMCGTTKLVGLTLAAGIIGWASMALRRGNHSPVRVWIWAVVGVAIAVAMVLGFAWLWGFHVFQNTLSQQGSRFTSLDGLVEMISQQGIVTNPGFEPWMVAGWVLFFVALVMGPRPMQPLVGGYLAIAAAYAFFAGDRIFGWYFLTFFPVLSLCWGWALVRAWDAPRSPVALALMFLLLCCCGITWMTDYPATRPWGRYAYVAFAALLLLPWRDDARQVYRVTLARTLLVLFLLIGLSGQIEKQIRVEIAYRAYHKIHPRPLLDPDIH